MLSEFRKRKFLNLFRHLDVDNNHIIDTEDFTRYVATMKEKRKWSDDEPKLARLIATTDAWWADMQRRVGDGGDQIAKRQWLQFFEQLGEEMAGGGDPPQWARDLCLETHRILDLEGDGTINLEEYTFWLECIGSSAEPEEAFRKLDFNGDGVIDVSEMVQLFTQYVTSDDPADPGNYIMTGTV